MAYNVSFHKLLYLTVLSTMKIVIFTRFYWSLDLFELYAHMQVQLGFRVSDSKSFSWVVSRQVDKTTEVILIKLLKF